MSEQPEQYFILIYHLPQKAVDILPYGADNRAATDAYGLFETQYRGDKEIEVILVGADSIETIQRTHAHYFAEIPTGDLFDSLLRDLTSEPV